MLAVFIGDFPGVDGIAPLFNRVSHGGRTLSFPEWGQISLAGALLKTDAGPSLRAAVSSRAGDPSDRTAAPIQRRDPGDVTAATLHRVIFGEHERPFLSLRVKGQGHDDDNVDEETETPSDSGGTASFALCVTTRRAFILTKS